MLKVQLLLTARTDRSLNQLEARLVAATQRVRSALAVPGRHRRLLRFSDDPLAAVAHGQAVGRGFDAVLEAGVPDGSDPEPLLAAVDGLGDELADWIDPATSAALLGVEHAIVPGDGAVAIVFPLRRLASLTEDGFKDYWLNHHADVGRAVPGLRGYRQFHADPELSKAAAGRAGLGVSDFDGVAEGYYADRDEFTAVMSQPEVVQDALEDERRFIDHSRSPASLVRVVYTIQD